MTEADQPRRALEHLETANRVWEAVTGAVAILSTINAFISSHGGPIQVLVQIGVFGFALYIGMVIAVPLALSILAALERSTHRTSTETATAVIAIACIAGVAVLIRLVVFYDGIGTDFDTIGTTFTALVGTAVLLTPLVVLWWRKGSTPAT